MTTDAETTTTTTGSASEPAAAATTESAPSSSALTIRVTLDPSGAPAGSRWRCERHDGTPAHLAVTLDTPLTETSLTKLARFKCWCGSPVALVLGGR